MKVNGSQGRFLAGSRTLLDAGLPDRYDVFLLAGNVAAFLTAAELEFVFVSAGALLNPGGRLIIGTTVQTHGGPADQDAAASSTSLLLQNRFADWHLSPFLDSSQWSVSVYLASQPTVDPGHGNRADPTSSDGIFVLDCSRDTAQRTGKV